MGKLCPKCHGTGFELATREDGVTSASRCDCSASGIGERRLSDARIPRRYAHCTLEPGNFEPHHPSQEEALKVALDWVDSWPTREGLYFIGPPGTGKTHLAVGIAQAVLAHGARVVFYEYRELLKALQSTYDSGAAQREVEILSPVLDCDVLILDDVGAGRTTPWARDVAYDVIGHRYNNARPMIVTTNLPSGDEQKTRASKSRALEGPLTMRDRLGDALMSRLHEMCRSVKFEGDDYRIVGIHDRREFNTRFPCKDTS